MSEKSPTERVLIARIAASRRWALEADRTAATSPARQGLRAKFAAQITSQNRDVCGAELERRIDSLMREHMNRMSLRAAQARARRVRERSQS